MQEKQDEDNLEETQENNQDVENTQKPEWGTASSMMEHEIKNSSEDHQIDSFKSNDRGMSFQDSDDETFQTSLFKKSKGNYTQEYQKTKKIIQLTEQISVQEVEKIKAKLLLHGIKIFNENIGDQCLIEQIIRHSYRVFEIRIRMGIFSVQISVFSLHDIQYKFDPSKKYDPENKIKQKQFLFQEDVVCQKFENAITADTSPYNIKLSRPFFIMFLKELAFTKIFSVLKIGPKFCQPLGFDMIRYKNGFTFTIQKCYPIQLSPPTQNKAKFKYEKIIYKKDINHLKKNLSIMHNLKILHADIKQANIMYSISWGQCVFIDFGICTCVKQGPNQGTLIKGWMGPKVGLSDQMKELKDLERTITTSISFYINDLQLFLKFIAQCYYQLNPQKDPYESNFKNFADPYQNSMLEIIEDKKLLKWSIFKRATTDLLWVRFFNHLYIGDYKKIRNQIQFLLNHSEPNLSKDQIMSTLNQTLMKTESQIEKCFYLNDLNPQIYKFLQQISKLKHQHNDLYEFGKNFFLTKFSFQNEQIVESLFYSVKKKLTEERDLLIEDLTNNFISLIHQDQTLNASILKPNFYQVQRWFLDRCYDQKSSLISMENSDENLEHTLFDTKDFIEKYLFLISFRRRMGTSTFEKRKVIVDYFNKKMRSFPNFYFQEELNKTGLILSYGIAQIFFKKYLVQEYINFEPFLDSYWIILSWIFRDEKLQQIKGECKQQKLTVIKIGIQILYNLALCGYYNEELHILVGEWIVQLLDSQQDWIQENESKVHESFAWIQKLNILLILKEIKELSLYTTSFPFLRNNLIMQTEPQNPIQVDVIQEDYNESKVINKTYYQFQRAYLKNYQPSKTSSKLEADAMLLYQQFLQFEQHGKVFEKLKLIVEKSQKLMNQNPQQMLQLYKVINVTNLLHMKIRKPAEFFTVINKCKLYSQYEKQSPIPQSILDSLEMTYPQKKRLKQKYKDAYFQPQMFVILSFLKLISQTHSSIELLLYQKIDDLIWYNDLSKYIFLLPRLRKNLVQQVSYFVKIKKENDELSQQRQIVIPPLNQLVDLSLIKKLRNHKQLMRARNKFYSVSDADFLFRTLKFLNEIRFYLKNQEDRDQITFFAQALQNEFNQITGNFFSRMMGQIKFGKAKNLQLLIDIISFSEIFIKSSKYKFGEDKNDETRNEFQTFEKSERETNHIHLFKSFLKEIHLKSKQMNIFIRDPSKNLAQVEYAQLLLMLLTVAQIRINLHLEKRSKDLTMLIKNHQYLALKLKSFSEIFEMVTYTLKNLNINIILFYIVDTFVRCIQAEITLTKKQLQAISLQKLSSLQNVFAQSPTLLKDTFLSESRTFKNCEEVIQKDSIYQYMGKTEAKSFIISQEPKRPISSKSIQFSQLHSFYPNQKCEKVKTQRKTYQASETERQKFLKRLLKTLNEELTEDNSRLNSTILKIYEEYLKGGQRQILFAKYIKTANQLCQIFVNAIFSINNKKQKDSFAQRWYQKMKHEQKMKPKYDPLVLPRVERIRNEQTNVFDIMWNFLLILTKKYSLQYSEMYLGELIGLYCLNFRRLGFVTLLKFIQFIYENVGAHFETKPQNLISMENSSQSLTPTHKTKLSVGITLINLRLVPLILSLANQELIKAFEVRDRSSQKCTFPQLVQIFMRSSLGTNCMFIRNCALKNPNSKSQSQLPLYFCRRIQDKELVPDVIRKTVSKNLTSSQVEIQYGKRLATQIQEKKMPKDSSNTDEKFSIETENLIRSDSQQFDLFYSKKDDKRKESNSTAVNKNQIIPQIRKIINEQSIFTKIRQDAKIVLITMKSYIEDFFVKSQNKNQSNQFMEKIYSLAIDTGKQLFMDPEILLKIEFIHFYTIIGKDYETFNYFFQLSAKINRSELFAKISLEMNLLRDESSKKMVWINLYKKSKKRSKLFNSYRLSQLVDLQKSARAKKEQGQEGIFLQRDNEGEDIRNFNTHMGTKKLTHIIGALKKKSQNYKQAYARLLLHRLTILK